MSWCLLHLSIHMVVFWQVYWKQDSNTGSVKVQGWIRGGWGRTHHQLQVLGTSIACTCLSVLQDKVIRCCASGHLLQLYLPLHLCKEIIEVLLSPAWKWNLPLSTAHRWCNDPWHVMWTHTPLTSWSNCRFISWPFDFTERTEVTSHSDSDKDTFPSCFPLHQHSLQVMAYCLCLFIHHSICLVMTHIFFFTVYSIGSGSLLENHFLCFP